MVGRVLRLLINDDAAGNRIRIAERNGGATSPYTLTYFAYDEINQLINERRQDTIGYATAYGYDPVGNRLTANSLGALTTLQYAPGNLLVSEQSQNALTTYSHDQAGNRSAIDTADGRTTFQWDSDNRLVEVQNPDGSSEQLGYDGAGTRRRRVVTPAVGAAVTTNFVYDGYNLNQERDENGLITAAYAWGPERWDTSPLGHFEGGEVDNTLLMQRRVLVPGDLAGGVSSYFGCDPSFNNRLVFDIAGNVTDRLTWKAFGELFAHSGSTVMPYGFGGAVGYYLDAMNRLNVTWRVYDPMVGQWNSADPLGFFGGDRNLYRYVHNRPTQFQDPSGLACLLGLSFPLSLPKFTVFGLPVSISGSFCFSCWSCCQSKQWCAEGSLGLSIGLITLSDINEMLKSPGRLESFFATVITHPFSTGFFSIGIGSPWSSLTSCEIGCQPYLGQTRSWDDITNILRGACLSFCEVFAKGGICWDRNSGFSPTADWSPCGTFSMTGTATFRVCI